MRETPEQKKFRVKVQHYLTPLEKEIENLKDEISALKENKKRGEDDVIKRIMKRIPLYTRINVTLQMQYLELMIQPDRPATDKETAAAKAWADKVTIRLIYTLQEWERDGAPVYPVE